MFSVLCVLASSFFCISNPVVDMREDPSEKSKVVSQAIFAEQVRKEKVWEKWSYIRTPDGYKGWILSENLVKAPYNSDLKVTRPRAHIYGVKDTEYGPIKTVPYGSMVQLLDASDERWIKIALPDGSEGYIQKGDVAEEPKLSHKSELVAFSQKFLGLPYTWGGRSSFGYDCSGFVQMLYSHIGIELQRDARQQVLDKRLVTTTLDQLELGDLLFWGKSEQKILHVGMYIGNNQFIHATSRENKPWIRISSLTDFEWSADENAYYPYRIAKRLK